MSPRSGKSPALPLYDMDSFHGEETPREQLEAAGKIVHEQMDEFFRWLDGRDMIPRIQEIREGCGT